MTIFEEYASRAEAIVGNNIRIVVTDGIMGVGISAIAEDNSIIRLYPDAVNSYADCKEVDTAVILMLETERGLFRQYSTLRSKYDVYREIEMRDSQIQLEADYENRFRKLEIKEPEPYAVDSYGNRLDGEDEY